MKRNSATTRGLVEFNGQQEQEEVRDTVAGDPRDAGAGLQLLQCASHLGPSEDAGEGSTGTKRGASKKYRTRMCMFYAEAFFYCPLKAFMKIHEIIHYEMK